ncbi:hypothetical protein ABIA61_004552 [Paenibacillus sp. RC21]
MLLMLQAIIIEIIRAFASVSMLCGLIWTIQFSKVSVERGMSWIGKQIRKRRNVDSLHK